MLTSAAGSRAALHARARTYHSEPGVTPPSAERAAVLARVGEGARVLEVGAHTGYVTGLLRAQGCTVTALEVDPRAAAEAARVADRLVVGDVEDPSVRARLGGSFDVVLFLHVLEHLVDPWAVLRAMHAHLVPAGRVVALLPNVACWRVRKALFLGGTFEYEDTGILDRTHLRFFTLDSGRRLLEASGFAVRHWETVDACVPLQRRLERLPLGRALARRWHGWMLRRHPNLCSEIVLLEAERGRAA